MKNITSEKQKELYGKSYDSDDSDDEDDDDNDEIKDPIQKYLWITLGVAYFSEIFIQYAKYLTDNLKIININEQKGGMNYYNKYKKYKQKYLNIK